MIRHFASLLPPLAALTFGAAQAQAPEGERAALEEIIVTAQKREERLQDVPISISVVSADTFAAFKLNETTDIQNLVPGVSLTNSAGPRNFGFFIRGIGTSSFASESIEGSTAYVLDGVVLGQAGSSLTDLPDVERVEVLRGPQGTLFGKNASAGVINVTTRTPATDEFHADASVSWADPNNERKVSGVITGPISDSTAFLLSARMNKRDGYIDNVRDGRELNNRDDYGVRGKLALNPSDNVSIMLIGDYWKRDAECCIWTLRSTGPTPSLVPEQQSRAAGIIPGPENERQNINGDVFSETESYGASAQIDYEFGEGYTFTSISAWRRWHTFDGLDSDSSPLNLLDVNYTDFQQRQLTQELRISSPRLGRFDYVAGLFYFDGDVHSRSTQVFATVPLPFFSRIVDIDATTKNLAAFGQVNFHLTEQLTLIAGGRALREETSADKRRFDPRLNVRDGASADKEDDAVVWRGGLQYAFTDNVMTFATATRGYKGGGYDTNIGSSTLPDVQPEEPTSYEVGLRTQSLQQGWVFNVTAFKTKVEGYQTSARDPIQSIYYIRNGEARTQGTEFDFTARPLAEHDLTLALSGAYIDAEWGDFRNAACYGGQTAAQGCVAGQQDLTGKAVPFSPKWTFASRVSYAWPIAGDAYRLRTDINASYRGETGLQFPNSPFTNQSAYTLLGAAIGFGASDDSWKLSLWGKNLTDKQYAVVMFPTPFGAVPQNVSQFIPYEARRVLGVSLDVSF
jgi:iron complex outermembrane receptor protein